VNVLDEIRYGVCTVAGAHRAGLGARVSAYKSYLRMAFVYVFESDKAGTTYGMKECHCFKRKEFCFCLTPYLIHEHVVEL
jgi:hypothetical protein